MLWLGPSPSQAELVARACHLSSYPHCLDVNSYGPRLRLSTPVLPNATQLEWRWCHLRVRVGLLLPFIWVLAYFSRKFRSVLMLLRVSGTSYHCKSCNSSTVSLFWNPPQAPTGHTLMCFPLSDTLQPQPKEAFFPPNLNNSGSYYSLYL